MSDADRKPSSSGDEGLKAEIKKRDAFERAEEEALLNLARTNDVLESAFSALFREHRLTSSQYNALRILRGEGSPLPCLEVASRMITRLPDITRLVDRLEESGLVERTRSLEDRRVVWVGITDKGRAVLSGLDTPVRDLQRRLLGHLDPAELAELNRLLVKARRFDAS
ncbi:MarR family transcriptional regulator [Isosphaeraceae bacterium EP7]